VSRRLKTGVPLGGPGSPAVGKVFNGQELDGKGGGGRCEDGRRKKKSSPRRKQALWETKNLEVRKCTQRGGKNWVNEEDVHPDRVMPEETVRKRGKCDQMSKRNNGHIQKMSVGYGLRWRGGKKKKKKKEKRFVKKTATRGLGSHVRRRSREGPELHRNHRRTEPEIDQATWRPRKRARPNPRELLCAKRGWGAG